MRQLGVFVGSIAIGAGVVLAIGWLTMPEPPPPFVAADADSDLPSPEDLNGAGAVVVARGGPVDRGVIEDRYEMEGSGDPFGGFMVDPPPDGEAEFRFGRAPRTLLVRWSWVDGEEGGDVAGVRATFSLPGATFFGREGECDLDLHQYETFKETQEPAEHIEQTLTFHGVDAAGILTCENLVAVGIDQPISYQAVFRIPDQVLYRTFG